MKTIVSDFDNTFYTLHYLDNISSIENFVRNGNYFFLATERNYAQMISEIKNFNIPYSFLICDDGALIYDFYDQIIYKKTLDKKISKEVFHVLENSRNFYDVWYDNGDEYTLDDQGDIYKIIAKVKDYHKVEVFVQKLRSKYPSIKMEFLDGWLHIMDKDVSKANAIEKIVQNYDLKKDYIYTVGDDMNDLSMLQQYKGFAMKDGKDALKKITLKQIETIKDVIDYIENSTEDKM